MSGTNCTKTCSSLCRSCRRRGDDHDHIRRQRRPPLPLRAFPRRISRWASNWLCCHLLRDSLAAQLEITLTKADSEQLARSIAEEQYSDLEKEKIMKELELKEMMARHRQELAEKDITISSVRWRRLSVTFVIPIFNPDDLKGFSRPGALEQLL